MPWGRCERLQILLSVLEVTVKLRSYCAVQRSALAVKQSRRCCLEKQLPILVTVMSVAALTAAPHTHIIYHAPRCASATMQSRQEPGTLFRLLTTCDGEETQRQLLYWSYNGGQSLAVFDLVQVAARRL
jgi:hypothetical protein